MFLKNCDWQMWKFWKLCARVFARDFNSRSNVGIVELNWLCMCEDLCLLFQRIWIFCWLRTKNQTVAIQVVAIWTGEMNRADLFLGAYKLQAPSLRWFIGQKTKRQMTLACKQRRKTMSLDFSYSLHLFNNCTFTGFSSSWKQKIFSWEHVMYKTVVIVSLKMFFF